MTLVVQLATGGVGVEYWQYEYNVQNRLVQVRKNGAVVAEYGYDVDGMRVVLNNETCYIYTFMGYVISEIDYSSSNEQRNYVYIAGRIAAEVRGIENGILEKYCYHQDNLDSTRTITNQAEINIVSLDYLPFGNTFDRKEVINTVEADFPYQYTGKNKAKNIDLYYYGARFYDSSIGRFISEDLYVGQRRTLKVSISIFTCFKTL